MVITTYLSKTHEAFLDAIVLRSLHTFHSMALDLVLRFLRDVSDTLMAEKGIEKVGKK